MRNDTRQRSTVLLQVRGGGMPQPGRPRRPLPRHRKNHPGILVYLREFVAKVRYTNYIEFSGCVCGGTSFGLTQDKLLRN